MIGTVSLKTLKTGAGSHMAEPMKEQTLMEEVRKNFLNFAVSKAPHLGMASAMTTRHSTAPAFCYKLDKGFHLWNTKMTQRNTKMLRNYGNRVGCNGKEKGGAESRDLPS